MAEGKDEKCGKWIIARELSTTNNVFHVFITCLYKMFLRKDVSQYD